jgi:tRNA A-37 threonylcarbamoyl transferase component Bud32
MGRGGMAEVYRAYHATLDRYVAIKILHNYLADDPEFKGRFEKEAQSIAKLKHPHIVQVYDFDYDAQTESYYMVMEFVDGPTLRDYLHDMNARDQRIPLHEVIRIIREAASALAYAHSFKVIHRDVKTANLMLDKGSRVVLTDFGIAKIISGPQYTATGGAVGTPAYMSPEQGMGTTGDERSDLYSLGVIFYELLTGELPFTADTPVAMILKHMHDPIPLPSQTYPDLPKPLDDIIGKLLAKDPHKRYQTATDLIGDLDRLEMSESSTLWVVPKGWSKIGGRASSSTDTLWVDTPTYKKRANLPTGPEPEAETTNAPAPRRHIPWWAWGMSVAAIVLATAGGFLLGIRSQGIALLTSETPTYTASSTAIPTRTLTRTPTASTTNTAKPTNTLTETATMTLTPTGTPSATVSFTPTPTPSITPTPTPSPNYTVTLEAAQTATSAACIYDFAIVDSQPADGEKGGFFKINSNYQRKITLLNTGSCAWEPNTSLTFIEGEDFNAGPRIFIRERVEPAATTVLVFQGTLPSRGSLTPFSGTWQLRTPGQIPIGKPFTIRILVYDPGT